MFAVGAAGNFTGNTATPGRVRQQHTIAPGKRQVRRQGGPFGAPFFLDHLDQQNLPALDDFLDFIIAPQRYRVPCLDLFGIVSAQGLDHGAVIVLGIGLFGSFGPFQGIGLGFFGYFFGQQGFPVGDGDLIIIGMDFAEGQKPVAVSTVIDKSSLQGRLDPGYFCQIDVASELSPGLNFNVEIFQVVSADDCNPSLLGVRSVDKHSFGRHKI